jgi:hypothetical protein
MRGQVEFLNSRFIEKGVDDGGEADGVAVLLKPAVDADVVLTEGASAKNSYPDRWSGRQGSVQPIFGKHVGLISV